MIRLLAIAGLCAATLPACADEVDAGLLAAFQSPGHVILMRHSLAPGSYDPATFDLDVCSTQRNLNDVGREQARQAGEVLRRHGIAGARVFTGRWCRNRETAELLGFGQVTQTEAFDSQMKLGAGQAERATELLRNLPAGDPVIVVTHSSNIRGLTGLRTQSGEMLVARIEQHGVVPIGSLGVVRLSEPGL